jgi:hypothetical protein
MPQRWLADQKSNEPRFRQNPLKGRVAQRGRRGSTCKTFLPPHHPRPPLPLLMTSGFTGRKFTQVPHSDATILIALDAVQKDLGR